MHVFNRLTQNELNGALSPFKIKLIFKLKLLFRILVVTDWALYCFTIHLSANSHIDIIVPPVEFIAESIFCQQVWVFVLSLEDSGKSEVKVLEW